MSQMKMLLCLLAGTLVLLGLAMWNAPPDYKVGSKVTIKDCYIWSKPVQCDKPDGVPLANGVKAVGSPGLMMRSGYSIGEHVGVVKKTEVYRRGITLRPDYRYEVEIQYHTAKSKTQPLSQTEWYYPKDLRKCTQTTTQPENKV